MVYIRNGQLQRLKEYQYSGVDHSLLSRYILKPYWWSKVIDFFPLSMAPNMITLSGFGFVVLNILTMLYYTPGLDQDCPRWVYASWGIGLFLYQTFDAVDGSQARRTKQSGPLGELFDHGVDALNTSLEVLLFSATMKFGQGWKTVLVLFACMLTFYVQTWDEYHTKTLTLGLVSGPVEGILTLSIVYMITAYMGGGSYWQQPMLQALGVPKYDFLPELAYQMDFGEFFMFYGGFVLAFNTVERYVFKAYAVLDSSVADANALKLTECHVCEEEAWRSPERGSPRLASFLHLLGPDRRLPCPSTEHPRQPSRAVCLLRGDCQRLQCRPDDHGASHQVSFPVPEHLGPATHLCNRRRNGPRSRSAPGFRMVKCSGRGRLSGGFPLHLLWFGSRSLRQLCGGCYRHHL